MRTMLIVGWSIVQLLGCRSVLAGESVTRQTGGSRLSVEHLAREMDTFHRRLVVYDDAESGGDAFVPSGWMMRKPHAWGRLTVDQQETRNPYSGRTCLRVSWKPRHEGDWAGIYWQWPVDNWGMTQGRDLRGATKVQFAVRSENAGALAPSYTEVIRFFAGGIEGEAGFSDSLAKTLDRGKEPIGATWQVRKISVSGGNLERVSGGFGLDFSGSVRHLRRDFRRARELGQELVYTIYLDDIDWDHERYDEPRLIRSYDAGRHSLTSADLHGGLVATAKGHKRHLRHVAYTYDNALAICALLSYADDDATRRARLIADAFLRLIELEGGYLCSAYSCGELTTRTYACKQRVAGSNSHRCSKDCSKEWIEVPRRPGWMDTGGEESSPGGVEGGGALPPKQEVPRLEDTYAKGIDAGNNAWAAIALLNCYEVTRDRGYLDGAVRLADWIDRNCPPKDFGPHGKLGFLGERSWINREEGEVGPNREQATWVSTEHCIDLAVLYERLQTLAPTQRAKWANAHRRAIGFVRLAANPAWNRATPGDDYLVTGCHEDTTEPNCKTIPLDPQTWSVLAYPNDARFAAAFDWALGSLSAETRYRGRDFTGYSFGNADQKSLWPEGMAQVVCALDALGEHAEARRKMIELDAVIAAATKEGGPAAHAPGSVPAAFPVYVFTGFYKGGESEENKVEYFSLPHLGATSWTILARNGWNPYWGKPHNPGGNKER